ncbi:Transposase DDE domain protein [Candidatus Bealeia paramacronuclearis]|uniref:Transposase DDE domain protein n=1 Tax=Candidatus Bealeia paramacronuclearis TaxID=1921001 RepID=A0ABZ2C2J1_9PROT
MCIISILGMPNDVIAGIGLVNLVWHGLRSHDSIPVDYRIYDKASDGKSKNDHFREMLKLAQDRGINPDDVVADAWYSSLNNLKAIESIGWTWVMGLKKNRKVNRGETLEKLDIPDEGLQFSFRMSRFHSVRDRRRKTFYEDRLNMMRDSSLTRIWMDYCFPVCCQKRSHGLYRNQ